jgi:3-oxoacyl-[acyl-carrier-protein] synthase-3
LVETVRSIVRGCGSYLPRTVVTNQDLEQRVATSDAWIVQRTGIRQRHIAEPDETTSVLGIKAAEAALADAGLEPGDIDLVVCATSTPDYTFPSTATQIQHGLGIHGGAAFDLQAVCTGFIYAVATADKFLVSGTHKRALVIGAETFSRIIDWEDRGTCVLFGDGAGALVLEAGLGEGGSADRGVLTTQLRSDGRYRDKLYVDGGPGSTGTTGHLRMEGREVFKFAVGKVIDVVTEAFAETGLGPDDLAWFVPHQANRRIIEASADKLGIDRDKVVITVDRHGNTSAASIPLALDAARKDGRIREGDLVMLEAIGGGFTWGSALLRW